MVPLYIVQAEECWSPVVSPVKLLGANTIGTTSVLDVSGVVPVTAIVPVFLTGTHRPYNWTTIKHPCNAADVHSEQKWCWSRELVSSFVVARLWKAVSRMKDDTEMTNEVRRLLSTTLTCCSSRCELSLSVANTCNSCLSCALSLGRDTDKRAREVLLCNWRRHKLKLDIVN